MAAAAERAGTMARRARQEASAVIKDRDASLREEDMAIDGAFQEIEAICGEEIFLDKPAQLYQDRTGKRSKYHERRTTSIPDKLCAYAIKYLGCTTEESRSVEKTGQKMSDLAKRIRTSADEELQSQLSQCPPASFIASSPVRTSNTRSRVKATTAPRANTIQPRRSQAVLPFAPPRPHPPVAEPPPVGVATLTELERAASTLRHKLTITTSDFTAWKLAVQNTLAGLLFTYQFGILHKQGTIANCKNPVLERLPTSSIDFKAPHMLALIFIET